MSNLRDEEMRRARLLEACTTPRRERGSDPRETRCLCGKWLYPGELCDNCDIESDEPDVEIMKGNR